MSKKVTFLKGAQVNLRTYLKGDTAEFDDRIANGLIANGYASIATGAANAKTETEGTAAAGKTAQAAASGGTEASGTGTDGETKASKSASSKTKAASSKS